ncbi:hypothetical protein [Pseudorhizobium tarimense]|uniref:hypothetical protein n=1 Tax=Pseudorhizobium tarimense TaxID=1079109 RepID=UPI001FF5EF28|nr:hypothetical protein [Pseudorhizobium tarimense]
MTPSDSRPRVKMLATGALLGLLAAAAPAVAKPSWEEFISGREAAQRQAAAAQSAKCASNPWMIELRFRTGEVRPQVLVSYVFGRVEDKEGSTWAQNIPVYNREDYEAWDGRYPHHYKTMKQRVYPNASHRLIDFPEWITGRHTDRGYDLVGVPRKGIFGFTVALDYGTYVYRCRRLLKLSPE